MFWWIIFVALIILVIVGGYIGSKYDVSIFELVSELSLVIAVVILILNLVCINSIPQEISKYKYQKGIHRITHGIRPR